MNETNEKIASFSRDPIRNQVTPIWACKLQEAPPPSLKTDSTLTFLCTAVMGIEANAAMRVCARLYLCMQMEYYERSEQEGCVAFSPPLSEM